MGLAPAYLRDLCSTNIDIPVRRSLCSTEQGFLMVSFARTTNKQNRAFSVVVCSLWNGLPLALHVFPKILSIYLSIYEIYIAPLQGNYSEALPAQARAKIKVLRSL